ncbi:hypothetical protein V1505DRAFT_307603 [Lipomyces doorenjongii]
MVIALTAWSRESLHLNISLVLQKWLLTATQVGDYPDYPYVSNQSRDPYEKYDDQQLRRNYNDPLHEDDEVLNMWSPDIHDFVSDGQAFKSILYFFATVGVGSYICTYFMPDKPAAPRVYPNGLFKELGGSEDFEEVYSVSPRYVVSGSSD